MNNVKVYIGCYKGDLHLLRSCIASIRYWNKEVPVILLKDLSNGSFDTAALETVFNATVLTTKYKKLGGYMKLQPYIEHPDERIFLQDADMVWLGDMVPVLKGIDKDIAVQAYQPAALDAELNKWYFNTGKLRQYYPAYQYPGFVFNCGSILMSTKVFEAADFKTIIVWQEEATPINEGVFLCEDQGIINYVVAEKYLKGAITMAVAEFQISAATGMAKTYPLEKIKQKKSLPVIVHWLGNKNGLNGFYTARHLLRFYENEYYKQMKYGTIKKMTGRLCRTVRHFDAFGYEAAKKIYYFFTDQKK